MKITKIYGPPGTGKTTTLISILKQELQDGIDPTEVAYLSHTKAASEEVKSRISEQFSDLDQKTDLFWFRTIHSACFRKLGLHRGMNTLSPKDYADFSKQTGYRVTGKSDIEDVLESHAESDTWDIVLTARSIASHMMCGWDDVIDIMPDNDKLNPNSRERFLEAWYEYKEVRSKFDFTDMLEHYHSGWGPLPVKVMFIDEAQDLSKLQWAIIKQMSTTVERMYVAGDDDQAIYGFMGADEYGFLDLPCDEEIILKRSYRCAPRIGHKADAIIKNVERRKMKSVDWAGTGAGEFDEVGVIEFLPWHDLGNQDTMVLCRHMKQVWTVKNMLDRMNIPCSVKGGSIVNNASTKAIEIYLRMRAEDIAVRPHEIARILERIGLSSDALEYRQLGRGDRKIVFSKGEVPEIDWATHKWPDYLAKGPAEYRIFLQLQDLLDAHGLDIIGSKPNIDVMTYHASKGKEADVVVMLTDVYPVVWDNPDQTGEIRLAYVGLTRAKERAIIVRPETGMYMRYLLGR